MADPTDVSESARAARIESRRGQAVLAATRRLIGRHGIEGATFELITQEAEVGRATVHWAFGTKERLLLELLKQDAAVRLESLRTAISSASTLDELLDRMIALVAGYVDEELGVHVLLQELSSAALREPEVGVALAERRAEWSTVFGELLAAKEAEGVVSLVGKPHIVGAALTALGHGLAMHALLDPRQDAGPVIEAGRISAVALLAPAGEYERYASSLRSS